MPKQMTKAEQRFADFLTKQRKTWQFEPCKLDTGIPCKTHKRNQTYTPDFWCPEDSCYYEVSATRQAYHLSMKKIEAIRKLGPLNKNIPIKIVKPDGQDYSLSQLKFNPNHIAFSKSDDYQKMVNAILEDMTVRELSHETGSSERAITGWKNGAIPQNLKVRKKIIELYKEQ